MKKFALIASAILSAPAALAQETDHSQHGAEQAAPMPEMDHSKMDHSAHGDMDMSQPMDMSTMMTSAFGSYVMSRDSSGTSWQPEIAGHGGIHTMGGGWMVMTHAQLDAVYTDQDGPRGDDKAFLAGMAMVMAQRDLGEDGTLQLRAMVSPDPFMGKSGYPLLLTAGETADGVDTLVDRQHPHDLFMELSASYSHQLTDEDSVFVYAGLPGEPAFGPPAFMHRPAAVGPEAPITHHWLDSTHITFGVVTAGYIHGDVKIEASRFRGREPDQDRYDIETGSLDSTAVRFSWNPSPNWALQASWADLTSPEQLEPTVDEKRWSVSALYSRPVGSGRFDFTGAFGRKERSDGVDLNAWLAEAAWKINHDWTIYSRAEALETDELGLVHHGPIEDVSKISLGALREFAVADHVTLGLGAQISKNWVSDTLSPLYGGDPEGALAFVRLKIS
ncbi:MAG TPA: hypothetical protein VG942_06545 [Hyphomonadaceae bacterium]|nr:hypothetical protein [Hyphomonadaceae bacterium]